jgi:hypothetical protein
LEFVVGGVCIKVWNQYEVLDVVQWIECHVLNNIGFQQNTFKAS